MTLNIIDCTLRDGGYYNDWDFSYDLINDYLLAMNEAEVDYVELGFRTFESIGFKGACAYTTDEFIQTLKIPAGLKLGVMLNASELVKHKSGPVEASKLLIKPFANSPVTLVRLACHYHEFGAVLPVCEWLKKDGYTVGINLMQIAERTEVEINDVAKMAKNSDLDALYFADSMGSLDAEQTALIVDNFRQNWAGSLGVHFHDNMGQALSNTLRAIKVGVTWLDSTVTGMGRGPGNLQTEYLLAELEAQAIRKTNLTPLLSLIRKYFSPMKAHYGWGTNTYYYLAGKYGIHPTYIQEMLSDSRYSDEDILSVINHLRAEGGKKFSFNNLVAGRAFFQGNLKGTWAPKKFIHDREVLILASGPGVAKHRAALESYVITRKPYVIALNANEVISNNLIDARAACHPVRLLADCKLYEALPQPLICPSSMLPDDVKIGLAGTELFDYGIQIVEDEFQFGEFSCTVPTGLVIAYALAIAAGGGAKSIVIAGMDGYDADDPRNLELDSILNLYSKTKNSVPIKAITPSRLRLSKGSVYQL